MTLKPFALALSALCVVCPTLTFAPEAQAQEQLLRTLTVTGQGTEKIPTSLTSVRLGVEVQGENAQTVQEEVARRSSAVVEFLRSRNVDQLETTGIRLQPNYEYNDGNRRLRGYIGTNNVSFQLPTEQAGEVMDAAVQAGASRIDGISFTATDSAIAAAQEVALRKATQDAQRQANVVLESLNLTRRDIVQISINGANTPTPPPIAFAREADQAAPSSPVIGGEQEVRASVTLQIRYD